MLHVQKYLRSNKTLEDLKTEHGVKFYVHNRKISLSYDQIEAKNSDPLSQQCRGLILREETYDIVACPMFRFFNLEQKEIAAELDWETASFEDKLDGSLIIAYYDQQMSSWHVATRSRPEADGNIDDSDLTFAKLADLTIEQMIKEKRLNPWNNSDVLSSLDKLFPGSEGLGDQKRTFCLELTSPFNRIVCAYDKLSLTLLAVRNNDSLEEEDSSLWAKILGLPKAETFEFKNVNHMIQVVRDWDPKEKEGVVVKDKNYNRVKVKNPAYVAYNHMRDSLATSFRGCVEVILLGKEDDVIGMMPEPIANRINRLKPVIQEVLRTTQADYDELKDLEPMKTFALEAQNRLWPGALFALKRNKTPDLRTFSLGNTTDVTKIQSSVSKGMLRLCLKLDPTLKDLKFDLEEDEEE